MDESARRMELLANALTRVLIADGVLRPDVDWVSYPELLMFAEQYIEYKQGLT